jgi:uncharacterized protein YjiS (DUF1127 family)
MPAKHLPGSENGVVRRYDFASDARGIEDKNFPRARLPDPPDMRSLPVTTVVAADCPKTTFWSSVWLSLCGASPYPTVLFPVGPDPDEEKIRLSRHISQRELRGPTCLIRPTARQESASLEFERKNDHVRPAEYVVALADYSLRERERKIKKAVAALAELDNRTLQDIGIPHRSQIEQVVRYCHDC